MKTYTITIWNIDGKDHIDFGTNKTKAVAAYNELNRKHEVVELMEWDGVYGETIRG